MPASTTSSANSSPGGRRAIRACGCAISAREMHGFFRDSAASTLQRAQFAPEHLPTLAMPPHEAVRQLVRNNVDYLPIERGVRPDRHHPVRGLSARHRQHRAGRAARRAGAPDARLSEDVRAQRQPVPRLRGRGPGHLPRDRARTARCGSTPTWCGNSRRRPAARRRRVRGPAQRALHQEAVGPAPELEADVLEQAGALEAESLVQLLRRHVARRRYSRTSGESPPRCRHRSAPAAAAVRRRNAGDPDARRSSA